MARLERVEAGRAGNRSISLYRLRDPDTPKPQPPPLLASERRGGGRPRLPPARSAVEAEAFVNAVGEKKPPDEHRQEDRAGDRGDLGAGRLEIGRAHV